MGDLDRNDFFQINTYMSHYQNHQSNYNLIAGGLLYPIGEEFNQD
jgi:5-methylcytosine-specific restriction enzyme subunit McrC